MRKMARQLATNWTRATGTTCKKGGFREPAASQQGTSSLELLLELERELDVSPSEL